MRPGKSGTRLEAAALAALGLPVLALLAPAWAAGAAPFWGDLTYLHHPWRAFDAQVVAAGRLPLWDPYLYLGMPGLASMQDALFSPGSLPFLLFGFPTALALFHAAHYWLAGALAYLWLRSWGLGRGAAWTGAVVLELGGVMLSRLSFLNHLGVLSLAPALLLFSGRPRLLAVALALSFLAGYPPFLVGGALAAFALALLVARRPRAALPGLAAGWCQAGLAAAALSAAALLPGAELAALSRRAAGVGAEDALRFAFEPRDLLLWLSPWLASGAPFSSAADWWKCCHLGFVGFFAAARGLLAVERRRAVLLAAGLGLTAVLLLGGSTALSRLAWERLPGLAFLRYPGNLSYLALPALALLVAAGARGFPRRRWLALAAAVELSILAAGSYPVAPRALFANAGPLVRRLQRDLGDGRYLLSPRALHSHSGRGVDDWKSRLYGLTNAPFRLSAAAGFGEPLVPRASFELLDALYSSKGAEDAAKLFPWSDIRLLLTPEPVKSPLLRREGTELWVIHRYLGPSARAFLLGGEGASLPPGLARVPLPRGAKPLAVSAPREDRRELSSPGGPPGWVFLSEPPFPGWEARLETPLGPGELRPLPALGAFQKFAVPAGPWTLRLKYDPASFRAGALLSVLSLLGLGAFCYHRLSRMADAV